MIWVDEARARLALEAGGLVLEHEGARLEGLVARPAYPFSAPATFVVLMAKDESKAMIADPTRLDATSRAALEKALAEHRFMPQIVRIQTMAFERHVYTWTVETERGPRTFRTRHGWGEEPVTRAPDGQLLITAIDGVRFRIPDPARLSERERRLLVTLL